MLAARRSAVAAKAAGPAPAARVRSVVVRAAQKQQQQPALQQKAKALGKALLANLVLAAPALAEEGKLFDFNATLPVVRFWLMEYSRRLMRTRPRHWAWDAPQSGARARVGETERRDE
jgi:hypothetical protein